MKAAEALALLAETEYFTTYRADFIENSPSNGPVDLESLTLFKESFLVDLMGEFENRKAVRPLVDVIDKTKRLLKLK